MDKNYLRYRSSDAPVPATTLAWNMYGAGLDNIGRGGAEATPVPAPADDQLLVRVDAVGLCFSDVKLIRQGRRHPKLYNRNLAQEPTRLGHEVALTVVKVGAALQGNYYPGQRLAVQPDIYQNGQSTAYGYTIPGGLTQYHLIGPEVLETDEGPCLLPLTDELGYAEAALLEPWGCVVAAYTQRRRLEPLAGGTMWIIGRPGDQRVYAFSAGLDAPATVVLTDVPPSVAAVVAGNAAQVIVRNGLTVESYPELVAELTGGRGFDDIVVLDPRSAAAVGQIAHGVARRGTVNLVGRQALDGAVPADVGRLHYDYVAFVGNQGPDIAASYGEARNRCELRPGGTALFMGAGGPMGQMHVQRALELADGPARIICTEVSDGRLAVLRERFGSLAAQHGRELILFNPAASDKSLGEFVHGVTGGRGADDVVVSVPSAALMAEAAALMKPDGMLVLFAGVPNGTLAPLNLSHVYLHNAQYTGTSGLTIHDQAAVMGYATAGSLSPARAVAAIGGIDAVPDGLQALMDARYPGKILIFPQLRGLPLTGLDQLEERLPDVAARLGPDRTWTAAAEAALIEALWTPEAVTDV